MNEDNIILVHSMSITLLIFMGDIFFLYIMRDEYLMRECEKGCQKAWTTVNIKTSILTYNI